jgi:hypothetical protein
MRKGSLMAAALLALLGGCNKLEKSTIESELTPIRDRACACENKECAEQNMQELLEWAGKHKSAKIDKDGQEVMTTLVGAISQCWVQKGVDQKRVNKFAEEMRALEN